MNPTAINRKIACITDIDPVRKKKNIKGATFEKCYPYECGIEETVYEYKHNTALAEIYPEKKDVFAVISFIRTPTLLHF